MCLPDETAAQRSCDFLYRPSDPAYTDPSVRKFQGCPTIAVTKGGRIYVGWYSGGTREPHIENFNLLVYSDDRGRTWSAPLLVIPSSKERLVQALDIQLWISPAGDLYVYWVQNNVKPADLKNPDGTQRYPGYVSDGYVFNDSIHAEWLSVCTNPDAQDPTFSPPRYVGSGFLRCKPLVLTNGRWLNFNYDQISDRYGYSVSDDQGNTWTRHYGGKKIPTPFDEGMAYQKMNGTVRMFARTSVGLTAESVSLDNGNTWTDGITNSLPNANTRFFLARTPSGRILFITNDDPAKRCRMTAWLSEDDGETFPYKRCIDARSSLSYPDADFHGDRIYLVYDRERNGEGSAREILFVDFSEEDILDPHRPVEIRIVSKP